MSRSQTKKIVMTIGLTILLNGCASTHNMKDGGESIWGGGYLVDEVEEGVFMITAKTNVSQLAAYDTARKMWAKHASKACGERPYIEKDIREYDYESTPTYMGVFRYIVTVKEGKATCQ